MPVHQSHLEIERAFRATRVWTIGDLLVTTQPITPTTTTPDGRRRFRVIEGGKR